MNLYTVFSNSKDKQRRKEMSVFTGKTLLITGVQVPLAMQC